MVRDPSSKKASWPCLGTVSEGASIANDMRSVD